MTRGPASPCTWRTWGRCQSRRRLPLTLVDRRVVELWTWVAWWMVEGMRWRLDWARRRWRGTPVGWVAAGAAGAHRVGGQLGAGGLRLASEEVQGARGVGEAGGGRGGKELSAPSASHRAVRIQKGWKLWRATSLCATAR